jgi:hypothetical protein
MAICSGCGAKVAMFTKECRDCIINRQNSEQQEAAAAQEEREQARQKTIKDEFERIQVDVKRGLPCFLHTSQYISVNSEITGTTFPVSPYDDSGVREAGLSGWKVVGTIPHTIGTALQNTEGFNTVWAGGVGGSVIGAYILLELEITSNNLEMMAEDILEYLEETV